MATKTIITCDRCKKELSDPTSGRKWEEKYPVHLVSLGYTTHPSAWVSNGNSPPPETFHGITIGELCDRCFMDFRNFMRDNWQTTLSNKSSGDKN